jgi:hypothetical protein
MKTNCVLLSIYIIPHKLSEATENRGSFMSREKKTLPEAENKDIGSDVGRQKPWYSTTATDPVQKFRTNNRPGRWCLMS